MSHPVLPLLDESLYPFVWQNGQADSPQQMLSMIAGYQADKVHPSAQAYHQHLYANDIYQDWINFTVFGRYIQRSFAAFYRQSEDNFNAQMPDILRHELMRHAQYLPVSQTLFFGGELPKTARQEKLFSTTLNPFTAWQQAQENPALLPSRQRCVFINLLQVMGTQVLGFAVRHNKRTSERFKSEVMVLHFRELRLVAEECISLELNLKTQTLPVYLRHYEIK